MRPFLVCAVQACKKSFLGDIVEMSQLDEWVREPTDIPDATGDTIAATRLSILVQPCRLLSSLAKGLHSYMISCCSDVTPLLKRLEMALGVTTELTGRNTDVQRQRQTTSRVFSFRSSIRGERAMTQYNNLLGMFHPNGIPHGVCVRLTSLLMSTRMGS